MKKGIKILLFILINVRLQAQIDKIMADKNIVWAAEIMSDLILEDANRAYGENFNNLFTLKFFPFKSRQMTTVEERFLAERLYERIQNGQQMVYEDSLLQRRLSASSAKKEAIDIPEDRVGLPLTPFDVFYEDWQYWRVRQVVYFNQKKSEWGSIPLAIAPMDSTKTPLFWIPLSYGKVNINSDAIVWAKRTATRSQQSNHLDFKRIKILKNTYPVPMSPFFTAFQSDKKLRFYKVEGVNDRNILSLQERKEMIVKSDTVITIHAVTRAESLKVVRSEVKPEHISHVRLVQDWYWDNKRQQLLTRLIAIAPMKEEFDDNGNFLYERPLFYQRYD